MPSPEFRKTAWSFPNTHEVLEFYRAAATAQRFCDFVAPARSLRRCAQESARALTGACVDPGLQRVLTEALSPQDEIAIPVLVNGVELEGRAVWVVEWVWEKTGPEEPDRCCHYRIEIIEPATGKTLDYSQCG